MSDPAHIAADEAYPGYQDTRTGRTRQQHVERRAFLKGWGAAMAHMDSQPKRCPAALNVAGQHFQCMELEDHWDLAHRNSEAQAIWGPIPQIPEGAP